mgnify:CR=1 FL=1
MSLDRRDFLAAAGGIGLLGGPIVGTSRGAEINITGSIETPVETSLANTSVHVYRTGTGNDPAIQTSVGSDVRFSGSVPEAGTHTVIFFDRTPYNKFNTVLNQLPIAYILGTADVQPDGQTSWTFTLPEAYQVQIRLLTESGDPIEGFPANFRFESEHGLTPGKFTTNADGYVKHIGATEPGVELVGQTMLEAQPLSNPDANDRIKAINMTEQSEIEVTVPNWDRYVNNGGVSDTSGSGADGNTRGFFTNDESSDGPLSNVMNLTVMGFLLSVGGIMYQLIEGR